MRTGAAGGRPRAVVHAATVDAVLAARGRMWGPRRRAAQVALEALARGEVAATWPRRAREEMEAAAAEAPDRFAELVRLAVEALAHRAADDATVDAGRWDPVTLSWRGR